MGEGFVCEREVVLTLSSFLKVGRVPCSSRGMNFQ